MKRLFAFVLSAAMAIGMLCGCGTEATKEESGIPVLSWLVPGNKQTDAELVTAEINKYIEEKIGAKLSLQFIEGGAFNEKMTLNMASNTYFDLCFTGYVNNYLTAAQRGGLMQIDELLKQTPALVKALPQYAWDAAKINGSTYAVPNMQIMASSIALDVRKDMAEKYNLDIEKIKNCADIEPFLEQIKQNEPDFYPFNCGWGVTSFDAFGTNSGFKGESMLKYVVALDNGDGTYTVKPMAECESYKKGVNTLRSWYEKGYIRSDIASVINDTGDSAKYAVAVSTYKPGAAAEHFASTQIEYDCIRISDPVLKSGVGRSTMTAIGKNCEYPDKAIKLIELMNTDKKAFNLISFGIEGKHYRKTGENRIELIESDAGYKPNAAWMFGNQFNAYLLPGQDDDVWEKTEQFNSDAAISPFISLDLNTEEIKTDLAQIETVEKTYSVKNNGSSDPAEYYDTYVKKLHEAGIDKVCETVQKQIDEYLAKRK